MTLTGQYGAEDLLSLPRSREHTTGFGLLDLRRITRLRDGEVSDSSRIRA
jgi:hypothetical protein